MTIIVMSIVLIIWTCYRLFSPENLALDEFFLKPLIWLTPVFLTVFLVERKDFSSLGFNSKNLSKNIIFGLAVGLIFSLERVYANNLKLGFSGLFLATSFFTAVSEEVFFRGYLLNRWLQYFKKPIWPLILNALYFSLTHVPIAMFVFHYQGNSLFTYLMANFVSGAINIFLFYQTRSVVAPIANHFIWNTFSSIFR